MSANPAQPTTGPTPSQQLMQLATGYIASACINVAAQLKIADLLAGGPLPVSELARGADANEDALYRVLRALASVGVFMETAPRTFANTPISQRLRAGVPDSDRDMVVFLSDGFHFRIFAELMHSVKTGGTCMKKVTGLDPFEYFKQDKAEGEVFHAAMTGFSAMLAPPVLEAYDFSGLGTVADVAGGHGFLLASILKKHSDLRGILFDLPDVVSGARSRIESQGLAARCEIAAGDFFKSVPAADSYVMKHVIHDWDDARAVTILKNCSSAMRGKGKVILIEAVISPGNEPHFGKWLDIEMLALPGGRERTEAEFADLFARAGLGLSRVVHTKSPVCAVEAVKL
jgi:hypothetical protein